MAIRKKAAENIRNKGFRNSKSALCTIPYGLFISEKNRFFNALASRYTLSNIDHFEKIEKTGISFVNSFFFNVSNTDLDHVLYDMYHTKDPLAGYIGFKSFKMIR